LRGERRWCKNCHAIPNRLKDLDLCSGCRQVGYCNRECQLQDWKAKEGGHKKDCKVMKADAEKEAKKKEEAAKKGGGGQGGGSSGKKGGGGGGAAGGGKKTGGGGGGKKKRGRR
jgi:uncharacterized membrane protein YgcG